MIRDDDMRSIDKREGVKLARYLSGRSTPDEIEELEARVAKDPDFAATIASYRELWSYLEGGRGGWETDEAWSELVERRRSRDIFTEFRLRRETRRRATPRWLGAAAALVIAIGGLGVWSTLDRGQGHSDRIVEMSEYQTGRGQRARLRLPDGSFVFLSVDTHLRVPATYGKPYRDIYLEGEALFEVEYDEARPFRVYTEGLIAEDLGTRFGVRRYPGDHRASVAVTEGRVALKPTASATSEEVYLLDPGDLGVVDESGEVELSLGIDTESLLAWAEGQLTFRDTPLNEAALQLSRWFDIDVELEGPGLDQRRFSATFRGEPARQVMELIALTLDLEYYQEGETHRFRANEVAP